MDMMSRLEIGIVGCDPYSYGDGNNNNGGDGDGNGATLEEDDGRIKRNQNLALALGIHTDVPNEDNLIEGYSESLLLDVIGKSTNIGELIKIEKRWMIAFINNNHNHKKNNFTNKNTNQQILLSTTLPLLTCSLKPMDRTMRKIVHEYATHWNINTESFDYEPLRYVHCTVVVASSAAVASSSSLPQIMNRGISSSTAVLQLPCPLLSDVVKNYKMNVSSMGRSRGNNEIMELIQENHLDTTNNNTNRENEIGMERIPLKILPRTATTVVVEEQLVVVGCDNNDDEIGNSRSTKGSRMKKGRRKKIEEREKRERRVMEEAFASSSDDNDNGNESDWTSLGEAEFSGDESFE